MTRYYFHLVDGHEIIPDRTGIDVADLDEVRATTLEAVHQFRQEHPATAAKWQDWRIEVTDAQGVVAVTLELGDREFSGVAPTRLESMPCRH
ncbi:DUF6894 family protein [Microvirga massiliensis]|uniref:DUF6894 family protein n=1 Tax=Microvirga massiliensis TaxID=1033741 RepID=UPI00062BB195|nr:hypothetical protein [Microvirga massiliensis]